MPRNKSGSNVATATTKNLTVDFQRLKNVFFDGSAASPDIVVGLSENAIQKFLAAHFDNNPTFYDRSREKNPNTPIFNYEFTDHGATRRARFWAKILKIPGEQYAIQLDLNPNRNLDRFRAWWRTIYGGGATTSSAPPNLRLIVPNIVLQINFPRFDGSGQEHQLDLAFRIEVAAYLRLGHLGDQYRLELVDWDIQLDPGNLPLDPDAPIWGTTPIPPACKSEIDRLRLLCRDLVTLGAKLALSRLASDLTVNLPLPPLKFIKGVEVAPAELTIAGNSIALGLLLQQASLHSSVERHFITELDRFYEELGDTDLDSIISAGPLHDPRKLNAYLLEKVPACRSLEKRFKALSANKSRSPRKGTQSAFPTTDLFIMVRGGVFDVLAKALLKADEAQCSEWRKVESPLLPVYGQGRACYWFNLRNARGSLAGDAQKPRISMGADLSAGGKLELRVCVRIPCAPDKCANWAPGLGVEGPCDLTVEIETKEWHNNSALQFKARFSTFPGFVTFGLPPGVQEVANAVIGFLTSAILKAFFNAVLSVLDGFT